MGEGRNLSDVRRENSLPLWSCPFVKIREEVSRNLKDRGSGNEGGLSFFCTDVDAAPVGHFCGWRPPYLILDVARNALLCSLIFFCVCHFFHSFIFLLIFRPEIHFALLFITIYLMTKKKKLEIYKISIG